MTRTVDINTGQSGALQSRGQPSQELPCCPGSPLPNPECSLPARMGQRQTVPKADGNEHPCGHMHGLQRLLEVLPTQVASGPQRGRGVPVTHQGAGRASGGPAREQPPMCLPASPGAGRRHSGAVGGGRSGPHCPVATLLSGAMSAESSSRHWSVRRPGAEPPPWGPNWRMGEGLALTSLKGSGTGPELGRASAGLGPFSTRELENRFSIPKREGEWPSSFCGT